LVAVGGSISPRPTRGSHSLCIHYILKLFYSTVTNLADWTERLAQLDFLLREEECKRLDAEEKYTLLEQEMLSQAMEMEEKLAEMERTYQYRLMEQVLFLCFSPSFRDFHRLSSVWGDRGRLGRLERVVIKRGFLRLRDSCEVLLRASDLQLLPPYPLFPHPPLFSLTSPQSIPALLILSPLLKPSNPLQSQQSQSHIDAKLEIMASSLTSLSLAADPLLEQKENIIRELRDENLELRLELESLRVGFRDGNVPLFPNIPPTLSCPYFDSAFASAGVC